MAEERPIVRVGILGAGTVGAAVVRLLDASGADIALRAGVDCGSPAWRCAISTGIAALPLPPGAFTADGVAIVDDPDVDVVVELLGGIEPARTPDPAGARRTASRS